MKLKYDTHIQEVDGTFIAVTVGDDADKFSGMIKLNKTGKELVELLKKETTKEEIHAFFKEKYDDVDTDNLDSLVDKLDKAGLIEKDPS